MEVKVSPGDYIKIPQTDGNHIELFIRDDGVQVKAADVGTVLYIATDSSITVLAKAVNKK